MGDAAPSVVGRGNADVVSLDAELLCEVAAVGVDPALDVVVPGVGRIAHGLRLFGMSGEIGDICRRRAAPRFLPRA